MLVLFGHCVFEMVLISLSQSQTVGQMLAVVGERNRFARSPVRTPRDPFVKQTRSPVKSFCWSPKDVLMILCVEPIGQSLKKPL